MWNPLHTKAIVSSSSQIATPVKNDSRKTAANIFMISLLKAPIELSIVMTWLLLFIAKT